MNIYMSAERTVKNIIQRSATSDMISRPCWSSNLVYIILVFRQKLCCGIYSLIWKYWKKHFKQQVVLWETCYSILKGHHFLVKISVKIVHTEFYKFNIELQKVIKKIWWEMKFSELLTTARQHMVSMFHNSQNTNLLYLL